MGVERSRTCVCGSPYTLLRVSQVRLHVRIHLTGGELADLRVGTGGRGGKARLGASGSTWGADDDAAEAKILAAAAASGSPSADGSAADDGADLELDDDDDEEGDDGGVEGDDVAVAGSSFEGDALTPGIVAKAEA